MIGKETFLAKIGGVAAVAVAAGALNTLPAFAEPSAFTCDQANASAVSQQRWFLGGSPFGKPYQAWTADDFRALKAEITSCGDPAYADYIDELAQQQSYQRVREQASASGVAGSDQGRSTTPGLEAAPIRPDAVSGAAGSGEGASGPAEQDRSPRTASMQADTAVAPQTDAAPPSVASSEPADDISAPTGGEDIPWGQYLAELYGLLAGFLCWPLVRPPLMGWYRRQTWIMFGKGPVDLLLKQITFRLGFEIFGFGLSVLLGFFGGWIVALFVYRSRLQAIRSARAAAS